MPSGPLATNTGELAEQCREPADIRSTQVPAEVLGYRLCIVIPHALQQLSALGGYAYLGSARIAAQTLASLGYTNVVEYAQGKEDWIEAGLPIESEPTLA